MIFATFSFYVLYQLFLVVMINNEFGVGGAGLYFFLLAVVTPVSNFFSLGFKQYLLGKSCREIYSYLRLRSKIFLGTIFLAVLSFFLLDALAVSVEYFYIFFYLVMAKSYDYFVDIYVAAKAEEGAPLVFFSNLSLLILGAFFVLFFDKGEWGLTLGQLLFAVSFIFLLFVVLLFFFTKQNVRSDSHESRKVQRVSEVEMFFKHAPLGVSFCMLGLSSSIPRYVVGTMGGEAALGVFGNILYSYVLGMVAVNAIAAKFYSGALNKVYHGAFILVLMFLSGSFVVYGWGEELLVFVYGDGMAKQGFWFNVLYPVLCLALLVSYFSYSAIQSLPFIKFFYLHLFDLLLVMSVGFVLILFFQDAMLSGALLLFCSAAGKAFFMFLISPGRSFFN